MSQAAAPTIAQDKADSIILEKYTKAVPRYTSYPTAPHFHDGVKGATYAQWLSEMKPDATLSLYLHIPFCDTLCYFCACQTTVLNRYDPVQTYVDYLLREIDMVAEHLPKGPKVTHVHWGGGSPSMLEPAHYLAISERLQSRFDYRDDCEVAMEVDPRGMGRDHVKALARGGMTRTSMGLQDFDPKVQKAINRVQTYEETKQVLDWLREEGIEALNVDLLYGLPYQTVETIHETIDKVLTLNPSRLALFGYAHVPWMRKHQELLPTELMPDAQERLAQQHAAEARFVEAGYLPVGLDHFAKPDDSMGEAVMNGTLNRNFQGYTTDKADALIGMGASSIGTMPQGYVQNAHKVPDYKKMLDAGELPVIHGIAMDAQDFLRRDIINTLMCHWEVDLAAMCDQHGVAVSSLDDAKVGLNEMVADGLAHWEGEVFRLEEAGRPAVRMACSAFDTYFSKGLGRHSLSV